MLLRLPIHKNHDPDVSRRTACGESPTRESFSKGGVVTALFVCYFGQPSVLTDSGTGLIDFAPAGI